MPSYGTNDNASPLQTLILLPSRAPPLSRSSSAISIEPHHRIPISACRAHSMSVDETFTLPREEYLLFVFFFSSMNLCLEGIFRIISKTLKYFTLYFHCYKIEFLFKKKLIILSFTSFTLCLRFFWSLAFCKIFSIKNFEISNSL